ncbi:unnamed protein product, partial [Pleuronectes platessa]
CNSQKSRCKSTFNIGRPKEGVYSTGNRAVVEKGGGGGGSLVANSPSVFAELSSFRFSHRAQASLRHWRLVLSLFAAVDLAATQPSLLLLL